MELLLLTAVTAGLVHSLEPDHMAAVTAFVSRRARPAQALGFGVRWGVGHSLAVMMAGGTLIVLDLRLPEAAADALELAVGAMLVALGAWLLRGLVRREEAARMPRRGHSHAHEGGHGTLWVGMAHGLAGTAPLLAILPVTLISSTGPALAYLLLFGVGTVLGMAVYAAAAGLVFGYAGWRVPAVGRGLRVATAVWCVGLGVWWMFSVMA